MTVRLRHSHEKARRGNIFLSTSAQVGRNGLFVQLPVRPVASFLRVPEVSGGIRGSRVSPTANSDAVQPTHSAAISAK